MELLCVVDYTQLVDQSRVIPLKDFPQLQIRQECKTKDLIVTGKLTREDIELPLENLLYSKFNREIDIHVEDFPGTSDTWRLTTEPEGIC